MQTGRFRQSSLKEAGLGAAIQKGLQQSIFLQHARDAMFAALADRGSKKQDKARSAVQALFNTIDEDSNGELDLSEFAQLVRSLHLDISEDEIKEAIEVSFFSLDIRCVFAS